MLQKTINTASKESQHWFLQAKDIDHYYTKYE
jgi:hypothetical protein